MHARLRGPKSWITLYKTLNKTWVPLLSRWNSRNTPWYEYKIAAFTVSEKSSNTTQNTLSISWNIHEKLTVSWVDLQCVIVVFPDHTHNLTTRTCNLIHVFEPRHEVSNNAVCTNSKVSDQHAHARSLIRAFASRLNILRLSSYGLNII